MRMEQPDATATLEHHPFRPMAWWPGAACPRRASRFATASLETGPGSRDSHPYDCSWMADMQHDVAGADAAMTPLRSLVHVSDQIALASTATSLSTDRRHLQQIAELESVLGFALLTDQRHGLSLTAAGAELVALARRTMPDLSESALPRQPEPSRNLRERRFITPEAETGSIELVDQTMAFVRGLARARSSMFFWVGPNCEIMDARCQNIEQESVTNYLDEMCEYDPLHIAKLKSGGQLIATLSAHHEKGFIGGEAYRNYCNSVGVGDEIDMLFWRSGQPFACLALFRGPEEPPFSLSELDWEALRRHVQASLRMHWRVRSGEVEQVLTERYGLQPRELDVVELILQGKSNADISDILQISIATVKVHVVNILKKLGVDSRLAVACVISRLCQA